MDITELKAMIMESLKIGDTVRTQTLRTLLSDVRYLAISKYQAGWESKVTSVDVQEVIRKQIKTHRESIQMFGDGNRQDLVDKESAELVILESFQAPEMSEDQLRSIISSVLESGETNFGKLMGMAMAKVGNGSDGSRVSALLRQMQG